MRLVLSMLLAGCLANSLLAVDPPVDNKQSGEAKAGEAKATEHESSVWMRKKMDYSQAILRGMAMGDFEAIKLNASQMQVLNKVEGFVRRRNPRYKWYVRAFEQINNEIVDQAKKENLAGVTLAFNQLTVNCLNCHSSLRKDRKSTNVEGE
jgi:hypothetical protein